MDAVELIAAERERQVSKEGWSLQHDDSHQCEELARAAACYAIPPFWRVESIFGMLWPWWPKWWKPSPDDRIRELVKAGALIVAEIERLQRLQD
jgi:hypothetical protein